jgi:hypothetical protein
VNKTETLLFPNTKASMQTMLPDEVLLPVPQFLLERILNIFSTNFIYYTEEETRDQRFPKEDRI